MKRIGQKTRRNFFFVLSIIIGFSIVAQAKSADGMNLFVSRKTITDLEVSIASEEASIGDIYERMAETEQKLEEYEQIQADIDRDFYETVSSELAMYKTMTGATAVHGPGITIVLDDSPDEIPEWADVNPFIVHDTDILRILSELGKSGAEAIMINGHRIYRGTTIYCNGYTTRINGEPEARPFVIQAIGDPANMSEAMISKNSYGMMLKDYYGLIYKVQVETDVELPAHPTRRTTFSNAHAVQQEAGD
ncbi:MAG: DUF881 domain-containing protein [Clostridiales Family XIII bacterium]|jgi:uncharacterized protein YlxW (UPF0749 family)|nr:DUF881 domain-containing protein [Clostridiales Family XIII bacterium]